MLPINLYNVFPWNPFNKRITHCHIQREINKRISYNIHCIFPSLLLVIVRNHVFCIVWSYLSFTIEDVSLNLTIPIIVGVESFDLHNFSHVPLFEFPLPLWINWLGDWVHLCFPPKVQQTLKRRNMGTCLYIPLMGPQAMRNYLCYLIEHNLGSHKYEFICSFIHLFIYSTNFY